MAEIVAPQEDVLNEDIVSELLNFDSVEEANLAKCMQWLNTDASAADAKNVFRGLSWERQLPLVGPVTKHENVLFEQMKIKAQRAMKEGNKYPPLNLQDAIATSTDRRREFFCVKLLGQLAAKPPSLAVSASVTGAGV